MSIGSAVDHRHDGFVLIPSTAPSSISFLTPPSIGSALGQHTPGILLGRSGLSSATSSPLVSATAGSPMVSLASGLM